MIRKTSKADLAWIREELLKKQGGYCPITGRNLMSMAPAQRCVDHCHKTGIIRAVLPRGINGLEGKVMYVMGRYGGYMSDDVVGIAKCLRGLADYIELHRTPQTEYIHHTHLTPAEVRIKRNTKARETYAKKKGA